MLSQNHSRYLVPIGFTLLASLFASDLLLKPPKELVLLDIDCIPPFTLRQPYSSD